MLRFCCSILRIRSQVRLFYILALISAANLPPVVSGADNVITQIGQTVTYRFNVTDPGDTFTIALRGTLPPTLTTNFAMNSAGQEISWRLTSSEQVISLQIVVSDSLNASSTLQPLIQFCGCENEQPCRPKDANEDGGSSRFISLQCNCSQGEKHCPSCTPSIMLCVCVCVCVCMCVCVCVCVCMHVYVCRHA